MPDISTITAIQQNIISKRGDTFGPVALQFFNLVNNVEIPLNISTDTFKLEIFENVNSLPALIFGMGTGITIINTNELHLSKDAQSMALPAMSYVYNLKRTQADGTITTELIGNFIVVE